MICKYCSNEFSDKSMVVQRDGFCRPICRVSFLKEENKRLRDGLAEVSEDVTFLLGLVALVDLKTDDAINLVKHIEGKYKEAKEKANEYM